MEFLKKIDLCKPFHAALVYGTLFGAVMMLLSYLNMSDKGIIRAGFTAFLGGAIGAYLASFIHKKINERKQNKNNAG